jgi:hypothetical protein
MDVRRPLPHLQEALMSEEQLIRALDGAESSRRAGWAKAYEAQANALAWQRYAEQLEREKRILEDTIRNLKHRLDNPVPPAEVSIAACFDAVSRARRSHA